jgi:hypothetical protein
VLFKPFETLLSHTPTKCTYTLESPHGAPRQIVAIKQEVATGGNNAKTLVSVMARETEIRREKKNILCDDAPANPARYPWGAGSLLFSTAIN